MPVLNEDNGEDAVTQLVTYMQCTWCGDIMPVRVPKQYAYKYQAQNKVYYFCGWNCMVKCKKANSNAKGKLLRPTWTWQREIDGPKEKNDGLIQKAVEQVL